MGDKYMLDKAIVVAAKAHEKQKDKADSPYILHPMRVMLSLESEEEQICGVLHDVIEDTPITLDDLRKRGFSEDIINALDCLTKREGENYENFIQRILGNELACRVKLADLNDNTNSCLKTQIILVFFPLCCVVRTL